MNSLVPFFCLFQAVPPPTPTPSTTPAPAVFGSPAPPFARWATDAAHWIGDRPWLALVAVVVLAVWIAGRNLLATWRHRHHADGARLVTIAPPPQVDATGSGALFANLAGTLRPSKRDRFIYGTPHIAVEYTWTGRRLQIQLWVPGTVPPGAVEAAVRGAWPGASCSTTDAGPPLPLDAAPAVGGHLLPVLPEWLPLQGDHDTDPLRALMSAGSQLKGDEHATVQILARPGHPRRIRRARRAAARLRVGKTATPTINPALPIVWLLEMFLPGRAHTGTRTAVSPARRDPMIDRDVRLIIDKTSQPMWETAIRYGVASTNVREGADPTGRLRGVADALASSFAVFTGRNSLGHRTKMADPVAMLAGRRLGRGFLTSLPELAALAGLPQDLAVPGLERARAKPVPAPVAIPTGGRGMKVLGDAEVGGHAVALGPEDARFHTHMVGSTGSGKTTLLANMILADIKARRGVVVIDPHGDLILDVLDRMPAEAGKRLVLFDPDQENPPTINPLQGDDDDLVVDNLVSIFGSIFQKAWGPRMDDVMRVSCLTLLRHPGVTLQHIPPLLNSPDFRAPMTVDLDDPSGLGGFWQWYDEMNPAMRSQVIGPVLARLRAFLLRDFVQKTLRYPKSSFDMGRILDGGILLVRIPKGILGEETSKLLGSLILAQVWQAATARASIAPELRKDASVYLDECQNFLTLASSLDTMLAEARKYRIAMTLAHQDLAQFPKELLAATSANARNKIYFSCSPEDAKVLSRHTMPELDEHDLAHLDAYTAAARLVAGGRQLPAFTMKTRPPKAPLGEAEAVREAAAAAVEPQDTSALDDVVRQFSQPPAATGGNGRARRDKGTRPEHRP